MACTSPLPPHSRMECTLIAIKIKHLSFTWNMTWLSMGSITIPTGLFSYWNVSGRNSHDITGPWTSYCIHHLVIVVLNNITILFVFSSYSLELCWYNLRRFELFIHRTMTVGPTSPIWPAWGLHCSHCCCCDGGMFACFICHITWVFQPYLAREVCRTQARYTCTHTGWH